MAADKSACSSTVPSLPPPCPKSPPEYPDLYGKRRGLAKVQILEREIGFLEEELKSVEGLEPASRCCKEVTDYVVTNPDPLMPTNRKNRRSCRFWKWLCGVPCFNLSWICCCCHSGCTLRLELPRCCDCNLRDCCDCNLRDCCDCNLRDCCDCNLRNCCDCCSCDCCSYNCCPAPKWQCCSCSCPRSQCCGGIKCSRNCCCHFKFPSCPDCSCCRWACSCCRWACSCRGWACSCRGWACSCRRWTCSCRRWACSCPKCPKLRRCSSCTKNFCNPCCLFF